jgi:hypothetical protein
MLLMCANLVGGLFSRKPQQPLVLALDRAVALARVLFQTIQI